MKKQRSIIMVGAFVFLLSGAFMLGSIYAQHRMETRVMASSKQVSSEEDVTGENLESQEIMVQPADQTEVSRELAIHILKEMPDAPLLQKNATEDYGDSSLENSINDVNATSGAAEIIIEVCKENGIDADTAKVGDLPQKLIVQIDQKVYQSSEHPKN